MMNNVVAIPELVRASIAGQTDRGKDREESRGLVHHASTKFGDLLIVADGAGDAVSGSQASRMAVDAIASGVASMLAFFPPEIAVEEAVRQANVEVSTASTLPEGSHSSMGVAVVVALLRMDTDRAHVTIGHVGDSRAYLANKQKLTLLTDESRAELETLGGKWKTADEEEPQLNPSAPAHLGQGLNIKVATSEIELEAGDTLLLCSSGLWRFVPEPGIERVLADQARSVEETCRALLDLALDAGGHGNVAIEIARLTQVGDSPVAAVNRAVQNHAVQNQSGAHENTAAPAIEWEAPQTIRHGTVLSDTELSATASVPGTFEYSPGPGAMLAAGEHTLSVLFTPSNESDSTPVRATVPLRLVKATPSITWPAPGPINTATPLGSTQLNARASVVGDFTYTPAAGALLEAGAHTLSVDFNPADRANYTTTQASVSLTVIEQMPAAITWPSPKPISYGTALGEEQLCARSSVPGSFLYIPAPGNVLPSGRHELAVIFTPQDEVKYAETRASVTLTVEEIPIPAPPLSAVDPAPTDSGGDPESAAGDYGEPRGLLSLFSHEHEASDEAANGSDELSLPVQEADAFRSDSETEETAPVETTLFGAYQVDGRQKRTGRWWTVASVIVAIPMLGVLIFLIDKAHSGAPFIAPHANQPAAGDGQPQPSTQQPDQQPKVTIDQASTGDGKQPAASSEPTNNQRTTKPAQAQTTDDRPVAPTATPQSATQQAATRAPQSSGSSRSDSNEPPSRTTAVNDRPPASNAVAVSSEAAAARLMESSVPIYPPGAKAAGISGTVQLTAIIGKDGTVEDLHVVSGPAQLRQAAMNCVRTWRYRPFLQNNQPTEVQTTINVVF